MGVTNNAQIPSVRKAFIGAAVGFLILFVPSVLFVAIFHQEQLPQEAQKHKTGEVAFCDRLSGVTINAQIPSVRQALIGAVVGFLILLCPLCILWPFFHQEQLPQKAQKHKTGEAAFCDRLSGVTNNAQIPSVRQALIGAAVGFLILFVPSVLFVAIFHQEQLPQEAQKHKTGEVAFCDRLSGVTINAQIPSVRQALIGAVVGFWVLFVPSVLFVAIVLPFAGRPDRA